jgi:hypothetical protein
VSSAISISDFAPRQTKKDAHGSDNTREISEQQGRVEISLAANAEGAMMTSNQYDMQNPLTQYPQPQFPKQPQPVPGLASKMEPVPDHGETSYRGLGRLKGRKALVTAATPVLVELPQSHLHAKVLTLRSIISLKNSPMLMR